MTTRLPIVLFCISPCLGVTPCLHSADKLDRESSIAYAQARPLPTLLFHQDFIETRDLIERRAQALQTSFSELLPYPTYLPWQDWLCQALQGYGSAFLHSTTSHPPTTTIIDPLLLPQAKEASPKWWEYIITG